MAQCWQDLEVLRNTPLLGHPQSASAICPSALANLGHTLETGFFRAGSLSPFEGLTQTASPEQAYGYFSDRIPTLVSVKRDDLALLNHGVVRCIRTAPANQSLSVFCVWVLKVHCIFVRQVIAVCY